MKARPVFVQFLEALEAAEEHTPFLYTLRKSGENEACFREQLLPVVGECWLVTENVTGLQCIAHILFPRIFPQFSQSQFSDSNSVNFHANDIIQPTKVPR